ncbi:hypothetical protein [Priestia megaterium]|uniref:Uncharacterized protein n=1 Tax=Priestia megaterium TaxID=1404 RepID=A0A6M6E928_PRIMG|nr:hypothetical protein [Priestia megaterium]QJX80928.1 hypothetical protein FDZ14_33085 [Priestia megaterium]
MIKVNTNAKNINTHNKLIAQIKNYVYLSKRNIDLEINYSPIPLEDKKVIKSFTIRVEHQGQQQLHNISPEEAELLLLFLNSYKKGSVTFFKSEDMNREFIKIPRWARQPLSRKIQQAFYEHSLTNS